MYRIINEGAHALISLLVHVCKRNASPSVQPLEYENPLLCVCVCGVLYIRVCSSKLILHIKFSDVLHLHLATLVSGSSLFLHSDTNLSEGKRTFMCVCVCV